MKNQNQYITPAQMLSNALSLHKAGNLNEAERLYRTLLMVDPAHVDALSLLGTLYAQKGNYEQAIQLFDKAIALNPAYTEAHYNRGRALQIIEQHEEALISYQKAVAIDPHHAEAHNNLGLAQYLLTKYENALASFDKAIAITPHYADAYWNKSLIKLLLGEYEEGWRLYEWRWKKSDAGKARLFSQSLWLGRESLKGKTILIHAEQGFGDTLQFCRYIPMVAERADKVVFECPETLTRLMEYNFPNVNVISADDPQKNGIFTYDYHTPLMSLPHVFSTTVESVPSHIYLKPEPEFIEKWKTIIGGNSQTAKRRFKIGLCWAGGLRPDHTEATRIDARRSLRFEQIKPLLDIENATFISLQMGPPKNEINDGRVKDISSDVKSWSDTAAAVLLLDLVISADTSVCHLAAAMGKKTFLLNRYDTCWRWLLDRDDSPWYPSLTQFRQKIPGDWAGVIERIKAKLEVLSDNSPLF